MTDTTEDSGTSHGVGGLTRAAVFATAALVPLNSTMIAIAIPRIADDFEITVGRTSLLVTAYLIAMLVGQPIAGRVSDHVGADRALRVALIGFGVASVAGTLAPTFPLLVGARLLQAAFGTVLSPSVQSLLRATTTEADRGATFGALGSVIGVGAAAGPIIGGILITGFGWQAVFAVNIPIVVAGIGFLPRHLPAAARAPGPTAADATGSTTLRNPVFAAGFAIQALLTSGQYLLLLLVPIVLDSRGWDATSTGLVLTTLTVGMIVTGPLGGRVGDRLGRRRPIVIGIGGCVVALAIGAIGGTDIEVGWLLAALALFGAGYGFTIPSAMTAALESVRQSRTGTAAGVLSMSRYVGSISTSALIAAWIADDGSGASGAITVTLVAAAVALGVASAVPGPGPASTSTGADALPS